MPPLILPPNIFQMRGRVFLISVLAVAMVTGCSTGDKRPLTETGITENPYKGYRTRADFGLNGPVKSFTETRYNDLQPFSRTWYFDPNGRVISIVEEDVHPQTRLEISIDKKGNPVDTIFSFTEYLKQAFDLKASTYLPDGKPLKEVYRMDGMLAEEHRFTYDKNGLCIRIDIVESNGELRGSFLNTYDENGNLTNERYRSIKYAVDGNEIISEIINVYDDKGNLIESSNYNLGELDVRDVKYYNEKGDLLRHYSEYKDGFATEIFYTYDKDGRSNGNSFYSLEDDRRVIMARDSTFIDEAGYRHEEHHTWTGGLHTSEAIFDKKGKMVEYNYYSEFTGESRIPENTITFHYDDEGYLTKAELKSGETIIPYSFGEKDRFGNWMRRSIPPDEVFDTFGIGIEEFSHFLIHYERKYTYYEED